MRSECSSCSVLIRIWNGNLPLFQHDVQCLRNRNKITGFLKGTQISYLNYWSKKSDEHTVLCFVPLPVFFLPFFDHSTFVSSSEKGKKKKMIFSVGWRRSFLLSHLLFLSLWPNRFAIKFYSVLYSCDVNTHNSQNYESRYGIKPVASRPILESIIQPIKKHIR